MSDKPHEKTLFGAKLVRAGMSIYRAHKIAGIAYSTLHRHLKKLQASVIEPPK